MQIATARAAKRIRHKATNQRNQIHHLPCQRAMYNIVSIPSCIVSLKSTILRCIIAFVAAKQPTLAPSRLSAKSGHVFPKATSQGAQGAPHPPLPDRPGLAGRSVSEVSCGQHENCHAYRSLVGIRLTLFGRQFIQSTYPSIRSSNPEIKIMIREASGIEPRAFARFGTSNILSAHHLPHTKVSVCSMLASEAHM
jgi:hypothetical protein